MEMETVLNQRRSTPVHSPAHDELEPSLFETTSSKLGIWLFIVSDALTFGALLAGYGFMRLLSPQWPAQTKVFDMRLITFMTFALISSSALMAMAVAAARNREKTNAIRFLLATIAGGVIFLGCQAYEWTHFILEGARPFSNLWGVPQFSASFFVITGFHGLHVLSGVVLLSVIAARALMNRYSDEGVEIAGLYWHFIDVVWVFVFAFFYLL
jgi:cytochrome c oxidase subunit III